MMAGIPGCFGPDVISNTGLQEAGEKHTRIHTLLPTGTGMCLYTSDTIQNQNTQGAALTNRSNSCAYRSQSLPEFIQRGHNYVTCLSEPERSECLKKKKKKLLNGVKPVVEEHMSMHLMYIASLKGIVYPKIRITVCHNLLV